MGTLPQQTTIIQYISDGVTTVYDFNFTINAATDIQVYVNPNGQPNPAISLQPLNTAYTVQLDPVNNANTLTFQTGFIPPISTVITIVRAVQAQISTNFSEARNINGANLDAAFEQCMLVSQQLLSTLNQLTFRYIIGTYLPFTAQTQLPILPNGYYWSGLNNFIIATPAQTGGGGGGDPLLRAQLLNGAQGADGAMIVGYYDIIAHAATTVDAALQALQNTVNDGNYQTLADTGTQNAIVCSGLATTLRLGTQVYVQVAHTNNGTAPTTLAFNTFGAKPVVLKNQGGNLPSAATSISSIHEFLYNPTNDNWQLIDPSIFCYGCTATLNSGGTYTIATGVEMKATFDTIVNDPNAIFNTTTSTITPKMGGWYEVQANFQCSSVTNACNVGLQLIKNGANYRQIGQLETGGSGLIDGLLGMGRVFCDGNTDTINLAIINSGAESITINENCWFEIFYLGNS